MKSKIIISIILLSIAGFAFQVSAQEEATESSDAIREKVKEKIEAVTNAPKAYLGSITDIVEETIQLENVNGEIEQITVGNSTNVVKINQKTTTQTLQDIAIGDFIVAMGFVDENKVLETKRILIVDEPVQPARRILFGKILAIEKKVLDLKTKDEEVQISFGKRWKGPEINELEEGGKLVAVVEPDDEGILIVRTIKDISESLSPTPDIEEE